MDKKISMGVIGDLGRYTQYQTAESIPLAAQNEGGLAGIGAGLGVGAGIGQAMAGAMSGMMQPNVQQAQQKCSAGCRRSAGEIGETQVFAGWWFDFARRF